MENREIDLYISTRYQHWLEFSDYHADLVGLTGHGNDILNEVLCNFFNQVKTKPEKLESLFNEKKDGYTGLDFFIMKAIKLNCQSKTAPYRWKYLKIQTDENVNRDQIPERNTDQFEDPFAEDETESIDNNELTALRHSVVRDILDELDVSILYKRIFIWKFFDENAFTRWPGGETIYQVKKIFYDVLEQITQRRKRKIWGYQGLIEREKRKADKIREDFKRRLFPSEYRHTKKFKRIEKTISEAKMKLDRLIL